jgi:LCP family protein required for cell wall assembly
VFPAAQSGSFGVPATTPVPPAKPRRRGLKLFLAFLLVVAITLGGIVFVRANGLANKIFVGNNNGVLGNLSGIWQSQTGDTKLEGETAGQINVLLLGIGGANHDGGYLTDTIILAQIRPGDNKAVLTSIPRDYLVNTPELGQRKINAVFAEAYAKRKDFNDAGKAISKVVGSMSGLTIPYFAVLDFAGFEKAIDAIGGVTVTVDRTFTDYTYPDNNEGYLPPVTFTAGTQTMNGTRALIFARSRHAAGPEGSDFARGIRQQKVIEAAKAQLVKTNFITSLTELNKLATIIGDHAHTNLAPGESLHLYELVKGYTSSNLVSTSLDPDTGIVCSDTLPDSGAYVLALCPGKTSKDVVNFFKNNFNTTSVAAEKAIVWLADSSLTQQLYKPAEKRLTAAGLTVRKVVYTGRALQQNVVYPVTNKAESLAFIQKELDASTVSVPPSGLKINPSQVDLVVILGDNEASSSTGSSAGRP